MHELSIAESLFDAVEARARECQAVHVRNLHLQIGEASGVVVDSLVFCFEMVASVNPVVSGAQLTIDVMPHRAFCQYCAQEFAIVQLVARCPVCGKWSSDVTSGTELRLLEMEIDTLDTVS